MFAFEIERKHRTHRHKRHTRMARSNKHMMRMEAKRTKNALTNILWFVAGLFMEVAEVNNFKDCYNSLTGVGDEATNPQADMDGGEAASTSSLKEFFDNLVTVIEFLCYIKDKLIDFFKGEAKRLQRLKRNKKMNFVEKRRTMTEAMRKKSWAEIKAWVSTKVGQVKEKINEVANKVVDWATAAWQTIKAKWAEFKAWVKTTWAKTQAWFAKVAGYIKKFTIGTTCLDASKTLQKPLTESWEKVTKWVTGITGRVADIVSAVGGNVVAMATIAAGIICAIPHVVKMYEIYKKKEGDVYYRWGRIIAQAGSAFAA